MKIAGWLRAWTEGRLVHHWAPLRIEAHGHVVELRVSTDAVRVHYDGGDVVRESAGAYACQQVADLLGGLLLTAKLVELRHVAATVPLAPLVASLVKPGGTVDNTSAREASAAIDHAIQICQGNDGHWLVSNVGKQFVLDAACHEATPTSGAVNHGLIVHVSECENGLWKGTPTVPCESVGPEWRIIQNRGQRHSFGVDADQDDYSQSILLVSATCLLDGVEILTARLYTEAELAPLVTHDGKPLPWNRHPGVPLPPVGKDGLVPVVDSTPTLKLGDSSAAVVRWQKIIGATADGVFGSGTERRTRVFQGAHGLEQDGVVGPKTWAAALGSTTPPKTVESVPPPPAGNGRLLPDVLTPSSPQEVFNAFRVAWSDAKRESLLVLLAQWALETGRGRFTHCYNLGNVKAKADFSDGRDHTFFACGEELALGQAKRMAADARVTIKFVYKAKDVDMASVWIVPDHPACCFRAFETLEAGVADYFELLRKRFSKSWPAVLAGNPAEFSHQLKLQGYYTADEQGYTRNVVALFDEFARTIK